MRRHRHRRRRRTPPVTSSITLAGLAEIAVEEGDEVVMPVEASDVVLAVED